MRNRVLASVLALVASLAWLIGQATQPAESLARLFPGNALVFVEARDFAGLLSDWNGSAEKKAWLGSDNYQVFSRSRLFLRLQEAQSEFAEAAALEPDMSLVTSVAGTQSALALYDIGKLEFLYVSRLPSSSAIASALYQARSSYESRNAAGHPYFVRSAANGRIAAFAAVEGLLLLATREDLLAGSLTLLAGGGAESALARDRAFAEAAKVAGSPGEMRIALNMQPLLNTPHFRSYWIGRNTSELRPYFAGIIDVFREAGQIREERVFLRDAAVTAPSPEAVDRLLGYVPERAGFYRAFSAPTTDIVLDLLSRKIVAPGSHAAVRSKIAPAASDLDGTAGSEADLETKIDEPPLPTVDAREWMVQLRPVLERAGLQAALQIQSSRQLPGGTFIGNESAIVLAASNDWPADTASLIPEAQVHVNGRILIVADRRDLLDRVVARSSQPAAASKAVYEARYDHRQELNPFTRMMRMIDSSHMSSAEDGPPFFSRNIASLGRVLGRFGSASITVQDDGSASRQQVLYRVQP